MSVTIQEFGKDLNKYLDLSRSEDVMITVDGKVVAKLSNPNQDRLDTVESLFGIISPDLSLEDARAERLSKV